MALLYCASMPLAAVASILWQITVLGRYTGPPLLQRAVFVFPVVYLPALVGGLWAARARNQAAPIPSD
jgi:uncharacterized membrane protein YfbV (UPF0208 family)